VIVSAHQPLLVEIEDLLATVGVEFAGEPDTDPVPELAAFLPGLELTDLESRPGEGERKRQIGPERIPTEVEHVELVPPQLMAEPAKRVACVQPLRDNLASVGLDADGPFVEDAALAWSRIRNQGHVLAARGDVGLEMSDRRALMLDRQRRSARTRGQDQVTALPPPLHPPVGIDRVKHPARDRVWSHQRPPSSMAHWPSSGTAGLTFLSSSSDRSSARSPRRLVGDDDAAVARPGAN